MNRAIKDIYVYVYPPTKSDTLKFLVRFPDNCEKMYTIDNSAVQESGLSIRNFIEYKVKQFYTDLNSPLPLYNLYFS